jgi:hypothetical protein
MKRQEQLIAGRWIPAGSIVIRPKGVDAVFYVRKYPTGRYGALGYIGAAGKPAFNFTFKDAGRMRAYLDNIVESVKASAASKAERAAEKKAFVPSLKVGDVLRTSWGYDQTNVEFFEVVKLIGRSMVEVRELEQEREATGWEQGRCVPVPGKYLDKKPLRKRVLKGNILDIHGGFGYARLADRIDVGGVKVFAPASWTSYA